MAGTVSSESHDMTYVDGGGVADGIVVTSPDGRFTGNELPVTNALTGVDADALAFLQMFDREISSTVGDAAVRVRDFFDVSIERVTIVDSTLGSIELTGDGSAELRDLDVTNYSTNPTSDAPQSWSRGWRDSPSGRAASPHAAGLRSLRTVSSPCSS